MGAKLKLEPVSVTKAGSAVPPVVWARLIAAAVSISVVEGRLYVTVFPTVTV